MDCCFWMNIINEPTETKEPSQYMESGVFCDYCKIYILEKKDYSFFIIGPGIRHKTISCGPCLEDYNKNIKSESDL